jgi:PEP-CTERM motif
MLFTLDSGSNSIKGTTHFLTANTHVDLDNFAFLVPVGMHLTNITYAFQTQTLPGTTVASTAYRLDNGNATPVVPFLGDQSIDLLGVSPVHPFGGALPLGPGTFALQQFSVTSTSPGGWTTNYSWTFDVVSDVAVPEPTSLCLFGTGLALAAARRRRQSRG